jgi:hypothetical protein
VTPSTSTPARRSRLRRPLAALVVAGMLGVFAVSPTGASVGAKSLCDTIQDGVVGAPAPPQGSTTTPPEAKKSLKLYKKFAKSDAPKGVKKALATIVSTLKELASGTPPSELGLGLDVDTTAYGKAAAKVSTYVLDKCVNDVIKDLPGDVDIPDLP